MAIAFKPPSRSTASTVSSSSRLIQSQSIFPCPVCTSSARCPIAKVGVEPMPISPASCSFTVLRKPSSCNINCVVQFWPSCPTYWRWSRQIGHSRGCSSLSANCVPHVVQIQFSIWLAPLLYAPVLLVLTIDSFNLIISLLAITLRQISVTDTVQKTSLWHPPHISSYLW